VSLASREQSDLHDLLIVHSIEIVKDIGHREDQRRHDARHAFLTLHPASLLQADVMKARFPKSAPFARVRKLI